MRALHASDDPKVVDQRLRSVKGLTDRRAANQQPRFFAGL